MVDPNIPPLTRMINRSVLYLGTEHLFHVCTMNTHEERDVATVYIPCAFIQADYDQLTFLKLKGKMSELFIKNDPNVY